MNSKSNVLFLILAVGVFLSCTERPAREMAVEQHKSMLQGYIHAMNEGDASYLEEYFAPNYIYHGPGGDLDLEGFKKFHRMVLSAFPGGTMGAEDMIAAQDKVITRWKFEGTHQGVFLGIEPTGNEVTVTGIIISRFENGKVVEEWEEFDQVGMLRQLGASPTQ